MARSLRSLSASSAAAPTHRSILYHRGKIQGAVIRPGAVNPAQRVTRLWTTPRSPKGDLVVTTPWGLGHTHLLPIAVEFLNAYPEIGLRLLMTDRIVDPVEENIDVAVRIGSLSESSMIAARIGSIRLVVCASPAYLAARGRPQTPAPLRDHDCITINDVAASNAWKFRRGRHARLVPIQARL